MRLCGGLKENPALCNINLIVIQTFLKHPGSVCPVMHLLYDIVVRKKDKRAISWGQNKDDRSRKTKLAIYRILLPFIFWISGNFVASERFHMERSASCGESRRLRGVARCWSHSTTTRCQLSAHLPPTHLTSPSWHLGLSAGRCWLPRKVRGCESAEI